jgi:hypothetical protein
MMLYLCTEATKTRNPELYLGNTLSEFMRLGLGIPPITGKRGSIRPLQDQMTRLFASNMRFYITSPGRKPGELKMSMINGVPLLSKFDIWFPRGIHEVGKWDGAVTLNEEIFERLKAGCMPVRQVDIIALQNSPMALDIYTWLAYSNFAMKQQRSRPLSWEKLKYQFGPEYALTRQFKPKFQQQLAEVVKIYPAASFEIDAKTGMTLLKSPTPVARKFFATH